VGGSPADTQVARSNSMNARIFSWVDSSLLSHTPGKKSLASSLSESATWKPL
jgi:hypothetical protein